MVDTMILAQWVVNVGRRDAVTRIGHVLCEMACRYGVPVGDPVCFRLPMTQSQMAEATGLSPVHVNRSLRTLEAAGVSFRQKIVRIESWHALVELAEFDPGYLQTDINPHERMRIVAHA